MERRKKIPKATITRLSLYSRHLDVLEFDGYRTVASDRLAWLCQVNPAQVRKDLGYFGEFGTRGVGYDVRELQSEIKKILAVNREWKMGIAGIGNLGRALLKKRNFESRGFRFVAAFDSDPDKIGNQLSADLVIRDIKDLKSYAKEQMIDIGVISTPYSGAQETANIFFVNAILNFSSARIQAPDYCIVENIDFTVKFDILTYKLKNEISSDFVDGYRT